MSSSVFTEPPRLYWAGNNDEPVHSIPSDSSYESFLQFRSNSLRQRLNSAFPPPRTACTFFTSLGHTFFCENSIHKCTTISKHSRSTMLPTERLMLDSRTLFGSTAIFFRRLAMTPGIMLPDISLSWHTFPNVPAFQHLHTILHSSVVLPKNKACTEVFLPDEGLVDAAPSERPPLGHHVSSHLVYCPRFVFLPPLQAFLHPIQKVCLLAFCTLLEDGRLSLLGFYHIFRASTGLLLSTRSIDMNHDI